MSTRNWNLQAIQRLFSVRKTRHAVFDPSFSAVRNQAGRGQRLRPKRPAFEKRGGFNSRSGRFKSVAVVPSPNGKHSRQSPGPESFRTPVLTVSLVSTG